MDKGIEVLDMRHCFRVVKIGGIDPGVDYGRVVHVVGVARGGGRREAKNGEEGELLEHVARVLAMEGAQKGLGGEEERDVG